MKKGLILGFFDGVHIAHCAVIKSAVEYADEAVLVTFKTSPAEYFGSCGTYIMTRRKSIEKIRRLGVNEIVELDFSKIANMNAGDYLKYLVKKFAPASISTGFNHTFGKNRMGNPEFLYNNQIRYGYKYICVPQAKFEGRTVSSTLVKEFLSAGEIEKANKLLDSSFTLEGTVIKGAQLGRKIGFPTANISYPRKIVKIPYGVYFARVNNKNAVLNWGIKPTLNNEKEPVVEVHILNFEGDLYGKNIEIEIVKRVRDERKFETLEELKIQIGRDAEECSRL